MYAQCTRVPGGYNGREQQEIDDNNFRLHGCTVTLSGASLIGRTFEDDRLMKETISGAIRMGVLGRWIEEEGNQHTDLVFVSCSIDCLIIFMPFVIFM